MVSNFNDEILTSVGFWREVMWRKIQELLKICEKAYICAYVSDMMCCSTVFFWTWRYLVDEDKDYNFQINHPLIYSLKDHLRLWWIFFCSRNTYGYRPCTKDINVERRKFDYFFFERWNRQITHYEVIKKQNMWEYIFISMMTESVKRETTWMNY